MKNPGSSGFTAEIYKLIEESMKVLLKLFPKIKRKGNLPNYSTW